jgi:hypothetical protein
MGARARRLLVLTLAGGCAVLGLVAGGSSATATASAVSPADRAATGAYVAAGLALEQAIVAAQPIALGAERQAATAIEHECPGILAQAPQMQLSLSGTAQLGPRARGEQKLEQEQLSELEAELNTTIGSSRAVLLHRSWETFTATAGALYWSEPRIAAGVHRYLALESLEPAPQQFDPCADMRAWVQSGYRTLASATREMRAQNEALFAQISREGDARGPVIAPDSPALIPFENRQARAQAREITKLRKRLAPSSEENGGLEQQLQSVLGIKPVSLEPPRRTSSLGTVRTAAGAVYRITVESAAAGSHLSCRHELSIQSEPRMRAGLDILTASSGSSTCIHGEEGTKAPVALCEEGHITVEGFLPATVHRVQLLLSDGHTIDSRVLAIPKRLGGPLSFYYQVVRGPSPTPVSLTEIDGSGHTIAVRRLDQVTGCVEHRLEKLAAGRTVVRGQVSDGGPSFTITVQREREGERSFLVLGERVSGASDGALGSSSESEAESPEPIGPPAGPLFARKGSGDCQPHPYEILYGLLTGPQNTVLAETTAAALIPLTRVRLPHALHTKGVLVYGAFSPPVRALIVRGPHGRTLERQALTTPHENRQEECEGEVEPLSS